DQRTVAFLKERRGVDFSLESWMKSDAGATYRDTIRIDATAIEPMLARPGDPGNGVLAPQLESDVAIDIAYGGSCTAGKREDFDFYHEVLRWGVEHGMHVHGSTRLY
ncbi:aconitase family protein, partial [Escherichia coli]|nr:aconitase family protein [Escherichia coli]